MKSWLAYVIHVIESPSRLLMATAQVILLASAVRALTDILPAGVRGAPEVQARVLFSDITGVAFLYAIMSALIAVVFRLHGWPRPVPAEKESLKARLVRISKDPEASLRIGLYLTLAFGLLTAVLMIVEMRDSSMASLWRELLARLWQHVVGAAVVLVGATAIVKAVPDRAAPPSGFAEHADGSKPGRFQAFLRDPRLQLKVGGYVLVYLALAVMAMQLESVRRGAETEEIVGTILIWSMLAVASGMVPVLFLWALDSLEGGTSPAGVGGTNRISRLLSQLRSPERAAAPIFVMLSVPGIAWFFIALWTSNGDAPAAFWAFVTRNLVLLVGVLAIPLVSWSLWSSYVRRSAAGNALVDNPARLIDWLILALLYIGLVMSCMTLWQERIWGLDDAWHIAMQNVTIFGVPVAILIGIRAIVAVIGAPAPARRAFAAPTRARRAAATSSADGEAAQTTPANGWKNRLTIGSFSFAASIALWGLIALFLLMVAAALYASAAGTANEYYPFT